MPRKCTARIPVWDNGEYDSAYRNTEDCTRDAVYLCADHFGRLILPRCEECGDAFTNKKPIGINNAD
jgi:hypothetical protein